MMDAEPIKSEQEKMLDEISDILKQGGKTYKMIPKIKAVLSIDTPHYGRLEALGTRLDEVIDGAIPSNWLDPLLTGEDAALSKRKSPGKNIESLLNAVKKRVKQHIKAELIELDEAL